MHHYSKLFVSPKLTGISAAFIKMLLLMTIASTIVMAQADQKSPDNKTPNNRSAKSEAAKLQRLMTDYWEDYLADNPGFATYIGDSRFDDKLYDISEEAF